ncbi:hypothetical protein KABACHOK_01100 [Brevundimonas phage vB_BpoS-Kabachok]|uniref:Lipoprotein n=1 Tax=Brevundimonas phage vB_BpoS-Kabachok TaxID=2948600 RepID=A0A9E7SJS6_9CAUD|nr:hypothetical protein KABACHOK_01100 [Brevundimonas phage vB_BpoS-Kabachok]
MTKTTLILAAAAMLLTAACNAPSQSPAPPVEHVPTLVDVGPNQTRPMTAEERRRFAADKAAQERAAVGLTRVFTGEHCVVYTFQTGGQTYLFAEGYRSNDYDPNSMACSLAARS